MKKHRSTGGPGIEWLEDRVPPGNALGALFAFSQSPAWSPALDLSTPGAILDLTVTPPTPPPAVDQVEVIDPAPVALDPNLEDSELIPMLLAQADPAPAEDGGGNAQPVTLTSSVAVPVSTDNTTVWDLALPGVGGDDQPSSAEGSGIPVPPPIAAPSTSGGAALSGGGGGGGVASNLAVESTPTVNTSGTDPSGSSNLSNENLIFLASNGYQPGMALPDSGSTSSVATAPVSKGLVKATASSAGLQSTGTRIASSFAQVPDPGAGGPLAISVQDYEYGYSAITLPDLVPTTTGVPAPVELDGEVTYPTDLSGGPHPLIMIMHGRHGVSYDPVTNVATSLTGSTPAWPPPPGDLSIPSFQGYRPEADVLASEGFIVVSIGANGINAVDNNTPDLGMKARAELIETQLNLWNTYDTKGGSPFTNPDGSPAPNLFVGKINMQDIGLMGHSRGGEGVAEAYDYNLSLGSPYGIKAVFALAPVDFQRFTDNNVPFAVMLPYADGDVSDLQGMHYFDDTQYNVPGDQAPKYEFLVMGADHDLFNTVWTAGLFPAGAADNWAGPVGSTSASSILRSADPYAGTVPGNLRLSPTQQQGVEAAYMSAFFNVYLSGQTQYLPILTGDAAPPPSANGSVVYVSYQAPGNPADRLDVNRTANLSNLTVNTLGGTVTESGLSTYTMAGGAVPEASTVLPGESTARQPDTVPSSLSPGTPGKSQLVISWDSPTAFYQNNIPAADSNVSGYSVFQFRAGVNFDDYRNSFATQDFSVVLTDTSGHSFSTPVSQWTNWLFYPPGKVSPLPKLILQGIRIPLSAFVGVNLASIQSVTFKFDQRSQGGLVLSDLQFSN